MTDLEVTSRPADVSLATVYDLDSAMGRRTNDLPLWRRLLASAHTVVEVGCGTGRVLDALRDDLHLSSWVGIDPDPEMARLFTERTSQACVVGKAQNPRIWQVVSDRNPDPYDAVIVPFSTLYLVPHHHQADVLLNAGSVLTSQDGGGLLAVECFVPRFDFMRTSQHIVTGGCRGPADEPDRDLWCRQSTFQVDGTARRTVVERLYGLPNNWRYRVVEIIHWRTPEELVRLADRAGLSNVELMDSATDPDVPMGHVVLTARMG